MKRSSVRKRKAVIIVLVSCSIGVVFATASFALARTYYSQLRCVSHLGQHEGPPVFLVVVRSGNEYRFALLADESRALRRYFFSSNASEEERRQVQDQSLGDIPVLTAPGHRQLTLPISDIGQIEIAINKSIPELLRSGFFSPDVKFDLSVHPLPNGDQRVRITAHWANGSWRYQYEYLITPCGITSMKFGMKSFATAWWSLQVGAIAFGVGFMSTVLYLGLRRPRFT